MKFSMKNSLELIKESLSSILLVFLAFLLMAVASFYFVSGIVNRQVKLTGDETIKTAQAVVSSNLSKTQLTYLNISQTVGDMLYTGKSNREILDYLEVTNKIFAEDAADMNDFLTLYGYFNGEFIDGSGWVPPEGYDPTDRPWYVGAVDIDEVFITEPYVDADTGQICISFSTRQMNGDGSLAGVLALDINLTNITSYMTGQRFSGDGYGVLISNSFNFVGHPDESLVGTCVADLSPEYAELVQRFRENEELSAISLTDYDSTRSVAFFSQVFDGWYIGIITPRSSYFSQVYGLGAMIFLLGIFFAVLLSIMLIRLRYERRVSIEESRSKSHFLSRMSHEMRTPMNAIIGMTAIAKNTSDPEKLHDCLEKVDVAASHLLGVINDVLDISKIESGKFSTSEEDFVYEKMLQRVISVMGHKFEEKQLNFSVRTESDVPYSIVSDDQRLAQVITNLLSNATKFTPENGKIELNTSVQSRSGDEYILLIEVKDNGIGITEQQRRKLFEAFEQADNTISRRYGGSGLGLTISRNIVEKLGGAIDVESAPGEGSRFFFTIKTRAGELDRLGIDAVKWEEQSLLLIDDDPATLAQLEELAQRLGMKLRTATGAAAALELIRDEPAFNVVLLSAGIEGLDCVELTRGIRGLDALSLIAILATGGERERCESAVLEAGANCFLERPLLSATAMEWLTEQLSGCNDESGETEIKGVFLGKKILVAEDIAVNREILSYMLEETGAELDYAENGLVACRMFEENPGKYDLILMDIHMPEMDGIECTGRIRSLGGAYAEEIPIIAMTADVFREDIDRCIAAGMDDHVGKPLNIEEVISKLHLHLQI